MKTKLLFIFSLLLLLAGAGCSAPRTEKRPLVVAAASDLDPALREIAAQFQAEQHIEVRLNFGSTGTLVRQATQGAPFDVLLAANEKYIDDLEGKNLVAAGSKKMYGRGRLVVWQSLEAGTKVTAFKELTGPGVKRIAIANPEHAPYGQAAVEALKSAGLYETVKSKLVYGENVSQALQFAQTGNAEVALVAYSLTVNQSGHSFEVDGSLFTPIKQTLCVLSHSANETDAVAFAKYVTEGKGKEVLARYGLAVPQP